MVDVLHLCVGFFVIMGALYLCAMRTSPGHSNWLLIAIATLLITGL